MKLSIHQPDYIPYLGFFWKVSRSDALVWLDDAQFSSDAAHNFNNIKTPQGAFRLKIPVEHSFGDKINAVRTRDEQKWKEKHLKTLTANYSRAKCFKEIFPKLSDVFMCEYADIAAFNEAVNEFVFEGFGLKPKIYKSSRLGVEGAKEQRVIDICACLGANEYISGTGARVYQNEAHFAEKSVMLTYSDYKPFEYKQLWGEFLPYMSVLDYIFNNGFDFESVEKGVFGV